MASPEFCQSNNSRGIIKTAKVQQFANEGKFI